MTGRRTRWRLWVLGLLVCGVAAAVAWRLQRGRNGLGVESVVLITLDTVRADRLRCYGGRAEATPRLDRLAAEGVRFDRALSTAPITLPAHASILSGTDPVAHGLRVNGASSFDPRSPSLALSLQEAGFRTGAFVSAFVLDRRYGLALGFDRYDDRFVEADGSFDPNRRERRGERTVQAALDFAREAGSKPLFLWVHLFDAHAPYQAPERFAERFDHPYDAEVAYVDHCVGLLLDGLAELGRLEDALIAVVADHGEGLGDHGESTHTVFVYDTTIRVPMILWSPGRLPGGMVVRETTSVVSLAPTLLDLLGLERPDGMYGPSKAAALVEPGVEAPAVEGASLARFESLATEYYYGFAPLTGIERDGQKLIVAPRPELYRPESDPAELENLYPSDPSRAGALKRELDRYERQHTTGRVQWRPLVEDERRTLAELGYIDFARGGAEGDGRDPKDGIQVVEALLRAGELAGSEPSAAVATLERLAREEPKIAEIHELLGEQRLQVGEVEGALAALAHAISLRSHDPELYTKGAGIALRAEKIDLARKWLEIARELEPSHVEARVQLGILRLGTGDVVGAERILSEVIEGDPEHGVAPHPSTHVARYYRAACLFQSRNFRLAAVDLEKALRDDPGNVKYLVQLAFAKERLAKLDEALAGYQRGIELDREVAIQQIPDIERRIELLQQRAPGF